jgi:hypothetical protein
LLKRDINRENVLLGNRWLCVGGSALIVVPSGVGKSTLIQQMAAEWACGRVSFGIAPNGPLSSAVVQAENDDDDDLTEIAQGVFAGLNATEREQNLIHANTFFVRVMKTGTDFLLEVEALLNERKPKLLVVDPLSAYAGGDIKDPALIAEFCRVGLNKLAFEHNCGLMIIHHTPKTNYRDTFKYSLLDFSYAGAGGADLTNWARAIISLEALSVDEGIFRLIAAKRGKRIGWVDEEGSPEFERVIRHSRERGVIRRELATQVEREAIRRKDRSGKPVADPRGVLQYIEGGQLIGKADLIHRVQKGLEIGEKKASGLVKIMLERGELHEYRIKRHRRRDGINIARHPQMEDAGGDAEQASVSCRQLPTTDADNT